MTYHDHNVRHSVRVTNNIDWEKFRAHSTRNYHGGKEKLKSCIVHSKMMVLRALFEKNASALISSLWSYLVKAKLITFGISTKVKFAYIYFTTLQLFTGTHETK